MNVVSLGYVRYCTRTDDIQKTQIEGRDEIHSCSDWGTHIEDGLQTSDWKNPGEERVRWLIAPNRVFRTLKWHEHVRSTQYYANEERAERWSDVELEGLRGRHSLRGFGGF